MNCLYPKQLNTEGLKRSARFFVIQPRAVVTGAAGFIGSQLVERLLATGHSVIGLDDFDDYYSRASKLRNLRTSLKHERFRFLERDLMKSDLRPFLKPGNTVFHLAAQPGVRKSWGTHFERYVRNNVLATQRLLERARGSQIASFVYASSSSVYGLQPPRPMSEDTLPNPISPYGVTKLSAEHLCRVYRRAYQVPTVSLRFFTVYGSRQRPDMAFHRFFEAIRHHRPLSIYGNGSQLRDFTHVSDILDGILAASTPGEKGEVYNLGGGSPSTLSDCVRMLSDICGVDVERQESPTPAGDPSATWADTRRAATDLGFQPKVKIREGLEEQWAWHVAQRAPSSNN